MFYLYWSTTNKLKVRISQLFDKHNTSKILLLVLLVFSFCPSLLNGQITWNKRYGVPGNGHPEVARSVEVVEDGYVVFFLDENADQTNRNNVMKLDLNGDSVFTKSWSVSPNTYYLGWMDPVDQTEAGEFVLGGGFRDTINYACLTKWNSELDTLWTRKIGNPLNWTVGRDAVELADGTIALVGYSDIDNLNLQIMVALFESNGDHIWTNYYGDLESDEDYGFALAEMPGDGIYIGGAKELNLGGNNAPRIIKIDYEGEMMWDMTYDDFEHNSGWAVPLVMSNDEILFGAAEFDSEVGMTDYEVTRLIRIDPEFGSIIWENTYGEPNENQGTFNVKEDYSNYIILSGSQHNETGQARGFARKIAPDGTQIWERGFQYSDILGSLHYNFDTEPTPDGGYVGCGYMITLPPEPNSPSQDIWVYKLDSMGCFVPGCGVGVEEFRRKEGLMKIGPNPVANGDLLNVYISELASLQAHSLAIYDAQGRMVKKIQVHGGDSTIIIPIDGFETGIYMINLERNNQVLESERLIIQ